MDAASLIQILGATGFSGVVVVIATGVTQHFTGSHDRKRVKARDIVAQRDAAEARADHEAATRRRIEEYASMLRRDCVDHGVTPEDLRPWPDLGHPPDPPASA